MIMHALTSVITRKPKATRQPCHPRAGGDPVKNNNRWIPACAGMTVMLCLLFTACGSGGLFTKAPEPAVSGSTSDSEFAFASDFPAKVIIPDLPGMRSTAFVVSVSDPAGIVAVDLNADTLSASTTYRGCILPAGTGLPAGPLHILSASRAVFVTSSHLIDCNPTTGEIHATLAFPNSITLPQSGALSRPFDIDNDGINETHISQVTPRYPGGLAVSGSTVYVSFSNYIVPTGNPVAAPGMILSFQLLHSSPYLNPTNSPAIVTSNYNPTGLRMLQNGDLLVVSSGVNRIQNARAVPITNAGLELYNVFTQAHRSITLGPVALAFQKPVVTEDERYAFVSSSAFNTIYMIDIRDERIIYGAQNPMVIDGAASIRADFVSSLALDAYEETLFAGSFNDSTIYSIQRSEEQLQAVPPGLRGPYRVGFAAGVSESNPSGTNTGIGALAVRPGLPGIDYNQPDLIALTAYPGKLVAIDTALPVTISAPVPESDLELDLADDLEPEIEFEIEIEPETELEPGAVNPLPGSNIIFAEAVHSFDPGPGAGEEGVDDQWAHYPENILGPPQGGESAYNPAFTGDAVFSLGCGGSIILDMGDFIIADGPGDDFIVFENAFLFPKPSGQFVFAEPAQVSVSQDGVVFTKFPCATEKPYEGCAGSGPTLTNSNNNIDPSNPTLAGGNSFDLADIGFQSARYVRIHDLNCLEGGSFDLDAISIVWGKYSHTSE